VTIALERAAAPEARTAPALSFKAATAGEVSGETTVVNEDEGIVTALVSVTGIADYGDDLIVPGAYKATLAKRRPKVCWAHSWEQPIGRVLAIEELMPGDSRLPPQTKDGQPWPAAAGAVIATMQMNLKSPRGREAFEAIKFYSETGECEYSIGYVVPPGMAAKDRSGIRHIKSLDCFELSFVLFGMAPLTGTLSLKDAAAAMREIPTLDEVEDLPADVDGLHADAIAQAVEVKRQFTAAARRRAADDGAALPDGSFPIRTRADLLNAIKAHGRAADQGAARRHIIKRARALGLTDLLPQGWSTGGKTAADALAAALEAKAGVPGVADTPSDMRSVERLKEWYRHGAGAAKIRWGVPGDFMRCVRIAGKYMTDDNAKGFCSNLHNDVTGARPGHAASEQKTLTTNTTTADGTLVLTGNTTTANAAVSTVTVNMVPAALTFGSSALFDLTPVGPVEDFLAAGADTEPAALAERAVVLSFDEQVAHWAVGEPEGKARQPERPTGHVTRVAHDSEHGGPAAGKPVPVRATPAAAPAKPAAHSGSGGADARGHHHQPAGSPKGGQFAPGSGGGSGGSGSGGGSSHAAAAHPAAHKAGPGPGGSHTIVKGDTLWDLAAKYLGDPQRWREIARLNGVTDPRKLHVGGHLLLPGASHTTGATKPKPKPKPRGPQAAGAGSGDNAADDRGPGAPTRPADRPLPRPHRPQGPAGRVRPDGGGPAGGDQGHAAAGRLLRAGPGRAGRRATRRTAARW
jgi:hypothetical protein